jgi:outer membrane receptor for ferrienterochelin and colicins
MRRVILSTLAALLTFAMFSGGAGGAAPAAAQEPGGDHRDGRIDGRVTRQDGTPLPGVAVRVDQLDQVAITDSEGRFTFVPVPPGTYELTFTLVERSATRPGVEVGAGATVEVDQVVDWDVSYAETITVTSVSRRAERIVEAPAAVTVVPEQEIEREASTGQVPKLLEFTPGVDFTQSGLYDFNFNTRGFNSSLNRRILTLIDGRDPSVPFLGAQEWAAISFPMDELSSVELVRGPGSALYGANAFNGVLNMTTRPTRGSEGGKVRLTAGELSTVRGDFRYGFGFADGWYAKLVGGYQKSDDFGRSRRTAVEYSHFCSATESADCLRREAVPLALTEDKTAFGGLRLDKYIGENVLTLEGGTASLEGPIFQTGIGRVQVTDVDRPWARVNFNTLHWNLLGYWDARDANAQVALASGAKLYEDSSNRHAELQGNTPFGNGRGFVVGGVAYHQQKVDTANPAGVQSLIGTPPRDEHQEAAFGQLEYNLTDDLKAVLAGRYDRSTLHDDQFSPKGSLVYSFTPNHNVRLTYNEAFQVPNYSEFFLRAPAGAPINLSPIEAAFRPFLGSTQLGFASVPVLALGNGNLDVEKIRSYEAGYSGVISQKLYLTLDYYQSRVENFVTDLLPGVNPAFRPYAPPAGVPAPVVAQLLATLRGALGTRFVGFTNLANGAPALVFSYANAGVVDTEGVDVAFNYYATPRWVLDASYSWFDFEVKEKALGDVLLPNAPKGKGSAGVSYNGDRWGGSLKYRWVDSFRWAAGVFVGDVPSYNVVDLAGNYRINDWLEVGVDVSNLLDDEHFQTFGGDVLSRRALGHVTFSW